MLSNIDPAATIDAELVGEAQQHEFFLAALRRLASKMHDLPPAFIEDVRINQLSCPLTSPLGCGAAGLVYVLRLSLVKIIDKTT